VLLGELDNTRQPWNSQIEGMQAMYKVQPNIVEQGTFSSLDDAQGRSKNGKD
jgi:hypothetical protein